MCDLSFTGHSHLLSKEFNGFITVQCNSHRIIYQSIIDKGPGVLGHFVYNASITFPKSQTDRKRGRPIRFDTAPLLPRPGPLFVCRMEFVGIEGTTLQGL